MMNGKKEGKFRILWEIIIYKNRGRFFVWQSPITIGKVNKKNK